MLSVIHKKVHRNGAIVRGGIRMYTGDMRARRLLAAMVIALFALSAQAQETQPRVTVLPFEGTGFTKADAQALTLFFETALQNTGRCQIIEQTEANKILKTHEYVLKDFNDPSKAIEIGKLLPANHIVVGTFGNLGGKRYVNVKLIDLKTGAIVGARNATATTLDALTSSFGEMAGQMMGAPPAAVRPPERIETSPGRLPVVKQAILNFFEGPQDPPPVGSRLYAVSFPTMMTRFVYWELSLDVAPPSSPIPFEVEAVFYTPEGSILSKQTVPCRLEAGSPGLKCWMGWGNVNPNNWRQGTYTVMVNMGSQNIVGGFFDIW